MAIGEEIWGSRRFVRFGVGLSNDYVQGHTRGGPVSVEGKDREMQEKMVKAERKMFLEKAPGKDNDRSKIYVVADMGQKGVEKNIEEKRDNGKG